MICIRIKRGLQDFYNCQGFLLVMLSSKVYAILYKIDPPVVLHETVTFFQIQRHIIIFYQKIIKKKCHIIKIEMKVHSTFFFSKQYKKLKVLTSKINI